MFRFSTVHLRILYHAQAPSHCQIKSVMLALSYFSLIYGSRFFSTFFWNFSFTLSWYCRAIFLATSFTESLTDISNHALFRALSTKYHGSPLSAIALAHRFLKLFIGVSRYVFNILPVCHSTLLPEALSSSICSFILFVFMLLLLAYI